MDTTNTNPFSASEIDALKVGAGSNKAPTLYRYTDSAYAYGVSRGAGIALFKKQCEEWGVPLMYTTGKRAGNEQKIGEHNHQFRAGSPAGRAIALFFAHKDDEALSEWKFEEVAAEEETEEEGE